MSEINFIHENFHTKQREREREREKERERNNSNWKALIVALVPFGPI